MSIYSLALARLAIATAAVVLPLGYTAAHEGKTPIHYVSANGADSGACDTTATACATIDYALTKAEKGDEVRVSSGVYDVAMPDPAEVVRLLSPVVPVYGGFGPDFAEQDIAGNPTILRGPDMGSALDLENRGLLLAQADQGSAATGDSGNLLSRGVTRYVAPDGVTTGDCPVTMPCTLDYALSIAGIGDAVFIAGGDYTVLQDDVTELLRPDITVQGGYLETEAFTAAAPQARPSYVTGPSFTQREALAARGLTLIQDRKSFAIGEVIQSGRALVQTEVRPATPCDASGMAGPYPCHGIDLLAHLPLGKLSTQPGAANDIWGFVDQRDKREYAIMGVLNGTAVIDVTDPENPSEVGTIPGFNAQWRDIKVYQFKNREGAWQAYAYVTADQPSSPQGLQIIDLSGLPGSVTLAATYRKFNRAHNIYISNVDYATGVPLAGMDPFAFILGSDSGGGAAHALDLSDPLVPTEVMRPIPGTQYAHDAASTVISGPRTAVCTSGLNPPAGGHDPCELLVDFNENTLDLWDVTEKARPLMLSSTTYANVAYTHSGWVSEDTRFVFVQDELDEQSLGLNTTMRVFDISDLTNPTLVSIWTGPDKNIDHNGFVKGDKYYMSAYRRGLSILDIATPGSVNEVAFFDTFPVPAANSASFNGAWGAYPFLPSGTLLVSNIEDGLFILRESAAQEPDPEPDPTPEVAFYEYPVKLVCGVQKDPEGGTLVRGVYATVVNIANVGSEPVELTKHLALTVPPGKQEPGKTGPIGKDNLKPDQAVKTDCTDIVERVFGGSWPADFFEGFVVVRSKARLEVQGVYSASQLDEAGKRVGGDVDIEPVPARVVFAGSGK
ncbi:choice-of-anchor B family protein [Roseovarius sp. Pro17]|uniref:choice-of-anchor B family protein n=1 Tax=Roseovarius sp. Pro17 TaxID=3108175 RepID=UPI002D78E39D|nr:choice-of-anchor B family protein [Roseovarius sp. Pro17]